MVLCPLREALTDVSQVVRANRFVIARGGAGEQRPDPDHGHKTNAAEDHQKISTRETRSRIFFFTHKLSFYASQFRQSIRFATPTIRENAEAFCNALAFLSVSLTQRA